MSRLWRGCLGSAHEARSGADVEPRGAGGADAHPRALQAEVPQRVDGLDAEASAPPSDSPAGLDCAGELNDAHERCPSISVLDCEARGVRTPRDGAQPCAKSDSDPCTHSRDPLRMLAQPACRHRGAPSAPRSAAVVPLRRPSCVQAHCIESDRDRRALRVGAVDGRPYGVTLAARRADAAADPHGPIANEVCSAIQSLLGSVSTPTRAKNERRRRRGRRGPGRPPGSKNKAA